MPVCIVVAWRSG